MLKYLESAEETPAATAEEILRKLEGRSLEVVPKDDLAYLARAEEKQAQERGVPSFKFADNRTMLTSIAEEKSKAGAANLVQK